MYFLPQHRLVRDFKLDVYIGEMLVSYRESIQAPKHFSHQQAVSAVGPASVASLSDTAFSYEILVRPLFDTEAGSTSGNVDCEIVMVDEAYAQAVEAVTKPSGPASKQTVVDPSDEGARYLERVKGDLDVLADVGLTIEDLLRSATPESAEDLGPKGKQLFLSEAHVRALVQEGITRQLSRGPVLGYPLTAVRVIVFSTSVSGSGAAQFSAPTSGAAASSASSATNFLNGQFAAGAARALGAALKNADAALLEPGSFAFTCRPPEGQYSHDGYISLTLLTHSSHFTLPVMKTEVTCHEEHVGSVLNDLVSRRRGTVRNVTNALDGATAAGAAGASGSGMLPQGQGGPVQQVIQADVPLAELRGYSSVLRSSTQGSGTFAMEVAGFHVVPQHVITAMKK